MKNSLEKKFNIPTIFVIFGGTGDLSRKKLFPSLFDLYKRGRLPDACHVVGVAHSDYSQESFSTLVSEFLDGDEVQKKAFLDRVSYVRGSFDEQATYKSLAAEMQEIDDRIGQCSNKLFHLSVSPRFYDVLLNNLHESGLALPCDPENGWTRVLIEKPFGNDLSSARALDGLLGRLFKEEQIYRIDHYLAKETVQNIIMFRFANLLFAPVWNGRYIKQVELQIHETIDVDTRGKFYDGIGALRDVGQNHLLQMFALIAMDNPSEFDAEHIRRQRASVLERTILHADDPLAVQGQYAGYRDIDGVGEGSTTETYFRLRGEIDSDKWRGTDFILSAGKALDEKSTRITVTLKEPDPCFCDESSLDGQFNKIIIDIQPEEKITVRFFAKDHGFDNNIAPKDFTFSYHESHDDGVEEIEAYERVLYDAIVGDQMLFASTEEVQAAWKVMMPVLERWHGKDPVTYERGSSSNDIK